MSHKKHLYWVAPYAIVGGLVSLLPLYGYQVHAARHDQWVFLILLAGWLASVALTVASGVMVFATPGKSQIIRVIMIVLTCMFAALAFVGFSGLADGFRELVAG